LIILFFFSHYADLILAPSNTHLTVFMENNIRTSMLLY